jgi:hypothetical protein
MSAAGTGDCTVTADVVDDCADVRERVKSPVASKPRHPTSLQQSVEAALSSR